MASPAITYLLLLQRVMQSIHLQSSSVRDNRDAIVALHGMYSLAYTSIADISMFPLLL